jgi:4-hydroxy-tetrahydrodipicolinate reductase
MGHMIERVAQSRGHKIVKIVDADNRQSLTAEDLAEADAVIEFTAPDAVLDNIHFLIEAGKPVVVGTTGWYNQLDEVRAAVKRHHGTLIYGSNFSLGVNILFAMNRQLARIMSRYNMYAAEIEESHHTEKKDVPSGTAITLAEGLMEARGGYEEWEAIPKDSDEKLPPNVLPIHWIREEGVPGIHHVHYTSSIDRLTLSHEAFNREGFALGAVLAAEFIKGKKGVYTPKDLFSF